MTMTRRQIKIGIFSLEALNSMATTYYFYYIYFFMQQRFGFDRLQNLVLAATLGFIYMFTSILGGRFAQRRGYFLALRIGFFIMAASLLVGGRLENLRGQIAVVITCTIGMCFT